MFKKIIYGIFLIGMFINNSLNVLELDNDTIAIMNDKYTIKKDFIMDKGKFENFDIHKRQMILDSYLKDIKQHSKKLLNLLIFLISWIKLQKKWKKIQ